LRTYLLREFQLRRRENVLYTYDFLDLWEWEIRVLDIEPGSAEAWRPRCLAGRAATPPEECGAQRGYMRILDQHKHYPPMAEQELVENALQCVAGVLPDQSPSRLAQGAARSRAGEGRTTAKNGAFYETEFVKTRCENSLRFIFCSFLPTSGNNLHLWLWCLIIAADVYAAMIKRQSQLLLGRERQKVGGRAIRVVWRDG
jgi:hypothetical protein